MGKLNGPKNKVIVAALDWLIWNCMEIEDSNFALINLPYQVWEM